MCKKLSEESACLLMLRDHDVCVEAVRSGSLDIVALLLSRGANFAVTSCCGLTAATLARRAQRQDIFVVINSHIRRYGSCFTVCVCISLPYDLSTAWSLSAALTTTI